MDVPVNYSPYLPRRPRMYSGSHASQFRHPENMDFEDTRTTQLNQQNNDAGGDKRWIGYLSILISCSVLFIVALVIPYLMSGIIQTSDNVRLKSQMFKAKSNNLWAQMQVLRMDLRRRTRRHDGEVNLPSGFIPFPFQRFKMAPQPPSISPHDDPDKIASHRRGPLVQFEDNQLEQTETFELNEDDLKPLIVSDDVTDDSDFLSETDKQTIARVVAELEVMYADSSNSGQEGKLRVASEDLQEKNREVTSSNASEKDLELVESVMPLKSQEDSSLESAFKLAEQEEKERRGLELKDTFYPAADMSSLTESVTSISYSYPASPAPEKTEPGYTSYNVDGEEMGVKCIGAPGADGRSGFDGDDGEPGEDGLPGTDGLAPELDEGECGTCPPGPPGIPGAPGLRGNDGPPGLIGPPGLPGSIGLPSFVPGAAGPRGMPGRPGNVGKQGKNGQNVITGMGEAGQPGLPGPPGLPGLPGERGVPAEIAYGPTGKPGSPGVDGQPGEHGERGEKGPPGQPGDDAGYCPCPRRNAIHVESTDEFVRESTPY